MTFEQCLKIANQDLEKEDMKTLRRFYTKAEALIFCKNNPHLNLFIEKELNGMFWVHDIDGESLGKKQFPIYFAKFGQ